MRVARIIWPLRVAVCGLGCALSFAVFAVMPNDRAFAVEKPPATTTTPVPKSIERLAAAAKSAFVERMEPPIPKLIFAQIYDVNRDLLSVLRGYVEKNFDDAIDALATDAAKPGHAPAVENALQRLVAVGQTKDANAALAAMAARNSADPRAAATALRHSVAFDELPDALAKLLKPPGEALPLPPQGDKALPAYQDAAKLDPADAWSWIVIAILDKNRAATETEIKTAEQSADASGDRVAGAFARQLYGVMVLEPHRQLAEADSVYADGLALARAQAAANSSDLASQRELARNLVWVCWMKAKRAPVVQARPACDEALTMRRQIAAERPDDARAQADLIASLLHFQIIFQSQDLRDDAIKSVQEAFNLYDVAARRSGFVPIFNPLRPRLLSGVMLQVLVSAGVLTLVFGLAILAIYRRRITRLMRESAKATPTRAVQPPKLPVNSIDEQQADIAIRALSPSDASRTKPSRSQPIARSYAATRQAAWTYAMAGCAFSISASYLYLRISELGFNSARAAMTFLVWAWPTILVLNLLWGRNRQRLAYLLLVYFAALLAVCVGVAFTATPPLTIYGFAIAPFFQPLVFWGQSIAPTLFLLLFLTRSIRAIGAVLFVFVICVACGYATGLAVSSMYNVTTAIVALSSALGIASGTAIFSLASLAGIVCFIPLGWIAIWSISRGYAAKRFSDQTLVFDAIYLFQTLLLWQNLFVEIGYSAWIALVPFFLYKSISWAGMQPPRFAAAKMRPARLLLLRTFGFRRRSERLFDQLSARWRYAGPIELIAAPDLAGHSVDPAKFLDFLGGRLRRRFVIEPSDLDRRLAAVDDRPDPDARYRINEVFCGDDAWREAVRRLMQSSDLVVMDLRGFTPSNQGCVFELQSLIDRVPVEKIVLLVDATADVAFLRRTLNDCWHKMAEASPNRSSSAAVTLLDVGRRDATAIGVLLAAADDLLAALEPPLPAAIRKETLLSST